MSQNRRNNAGEKSSKHYDEKEIKKFQKSEIFSYIPYWIKALFLKYWFFGAVCFFIGMGIQGINGDIYALVAGLTCGVLTDLVTDNILLMMDSDKKESRYYVIYKDKSIWSFLINLVYGLLLYFSCEYFCAFIVSTYSESGGSWFLQEPLSQSLVLIVFDMVCIGIKDLIAYAILKKDKRELL